MVDEHYVFVVINILCFLFSLAGMTQELGKLKAAAGELEYSKYPLGSRLFLYPYHVRLYTFSIR